MHIDVSVAGLANQEATKAGIGPQEEGLKRALYDYVFHTLRYDKSGNGSPCR